MSEGVRVRWDDGRVMRKQVDKGGVKHVSVGRQLLSLSPSLDPSMRPLEMRDTTLKVINEWGKELMIGENRDWNVLVYCRWSRCEQLARNGGCTHLRKCVLLLLFLICFDHAHYHNSLMIVDNWWKLITNRFFLMKQSIVTVILIRRYRILLIGSGGEWGGREWECGAQSTTTRSAGEISDEQGGVGYTSIPPDFPHSLKLITGDILTSSIQTLILVVRPSLVLMTGWDICSIPWIFRVSSGHVYSWNAIAADCWAVSGHFISNYEKWWNR